MLKKDFFKENAEIFAFLMIACFCLAVYGQVVNFGFINTDDNLYVYQNPMVLSGVTWESVYWAFTAFHSANWHPLTWISHQIDLSLFGLNAGAHHATNVIFHLLNSFLAFLLFQKLTHDFWKSFFVALIFAIHPTHVESVAWVSERKDVLSTMFWLLTMVSYLNYCRAESKTYFHYALTLLLFAFGLMSKPMLVTLPFVMLLCDYWPLERLKKLSDLRRLVVEKIPFFILTVISSYITFIAQRSAGAVEGLETLPLEVRIINAVNSYAKYVLMFFYPVNLGLQYAYERVIDYWEFGLSLMFLLVVTGVVVWQWKKRKYMLVGWLWFMGTLVPVIGLVQVGAQAMADRYTYVPYFGLMMMVIWGLGELADRLQVRKIGLVVGILVSVVFSVLCYRQVAYWRDDETLYRHSLKVAGESFLLAHNLCHTLFYKNQLDEATEYCRKAIVWNRFFDKSYSLLGLIYVKQNRPEEALNYLSLALEMNPKDPINHLNLANALFILGRTDQAEEKLRKFIELAKQDKNRLDWRIIMRAYSDIGIAYLKKNEAEKAVKLYERLVGAFPDNVEIRAAYAFALFINSQLDEAEKQITLVLEKSPNFVEAYNTYGLILAAKGRFDEAKKQFEKALQMNPNLDSAKQNLENLEKLRSEKK